MAKYTAFVEYPTEATNIANWSSPDDYQSQLAQE